METILGYILIATSLDACEFGPVAFAQGVDMEEKIIICLRQDVPITKVYSSGMCMFRKHSMDSIPLLETTSLFAWLKLMWEIAFKICGSLLNPR